MANSLPRHSGKYSLTDHINGINSRPEDNEWLQHDYIMLSWPYVSISMEILDIVMRGDTIAYIVWTDIESLFRDNKKSRAFSSRPNSAALSKVI